MARRATSIAQYRQAGAWSQAAATKASAAPVRILGIDPGSRFTGYGLIETRGSKSTLVAAGRIDAGKAAVAQRLVIIFEGLQEVIAEYQPAEIALEETFVNRANPQSALVLGQARGVAMLAAALAGAPLAEYAAAAVKLAIAGHGRADKLAIAHMVGLLLKTKQAFEADAADALAVALCHAHTRRM